MYRDDCEGVHPDVVDRHYGVHRKRLTRKGYQLGAGHPADEVSGDEDTMLPVQGADLIDRQQCVNRDLDAVHVPSHQIPFMTPEEEAGFFAMLYKMINHEILPDGFGLMPAEWEFGHYPIFETIRLGRRQCKQLDVSLADGIWYERACLWCQALVCLTHFTENSTLQ